MKHFLKKLQRDRSGSTALEFAIVIPFFLVLTISVVEFSLLGFATVLVEGGLREAARYGITGLHPNSGTREQRIAEILNEHAAGFFNVSADDIQTLVYPNFSDIGKNEPYTDEDGNNQYDVGEPYTDINCNGQWDADMGLAGAGGGDEVVLYTVRERYVSITGVIDPLITTSDGSDYEIEASIAVRNEPFPGGATLCDEIVS